MSMKNRLRCDVTSFCHLPVTYLVRETTSYGSLKIRSDSAAPAETALDRLIAQGVCDAIAMERARAVARETGISAARR